MSAHSSRSSSFSVQPPGGSAGDLGRPLLSGLKPPALELVPAGAHNAYVPPNLLLTPSPAATAAPVQPSPAFAVGVPLGSPGPGAGSVELSDFPASPEGKSDRSDEVPLLVRRSSSRSLHHPIKRELVIDFSKGNTRWKRGSVNDVLKNRRLKWNLAAAGTYAAMGITLALGVTVGYEYWNSAIKLDVLAKLHLLILGAIGSSLSNAAQTIYFLSFFVRETLDFWQELKSGALRNYSNRMEFSVPCSKPLVWQGSHVTTLRIAPFFLARTLILGTAVFNSLPVILASDSNIEVGMLSLMLLAGMNYSSVSKLLGDKLPLWLRSVCASTDTTNRIKLEKDIQYQVNLIIGFLEDKTTTLAQKIAIKEELLKQSECNDLSQELAVLQAMMRKVLEFRKASDPSLDEMAYLAREKPIVAVPVLSGAPVGLSLPSWCSSKNLLQMLLGGMFTQYALDQLPSTVLGIQKVLIKLSMDEESAAPYAFSFGLIAMSVSLIRYFDWAGMLFKKFEDSFALIKQHPTLKSGIYFSQSAGILLALISPAGSTEVALKGLNNYSKVNMYFLTGLFSAIHDAGVALPLAAIPGYISGSVMNSPGNMSMAVVALLAIHKLMQLYQKTDRTEYVQSLETDELVATLKKFKGDVGDNRHFNDRDLRDIKNALVRSAQPLASASKTDDLTQSRETSLKSHSAAQGKGLHRKPSNIFGLSSPVGRNAMFLSPSQDSLNSEAKSPASTTELDVLV